MSTADWIVLIATLLFIVLYGMWKSRHTSNIEGYLLADRKLPWYHVGLSVMATQASAITFLSAPGQGYTDGIRFVQFYFGLPLAMVVLCTSFIPIFQKLKVFTAYEFLEKRFDGRTRSLTAFLFLFQRGLSTGITIYAPAIILSTILDLDLAFTITLNGVIVTIYTVYGGTRAVSHTQVLQMTVIFSGLILAAVMVVKLLPAEVSFSDALHLAGKLEHLNGINTKFDLHDKYNLWSGIIGGFFLQLSYFGTDQSQVGRYLTGSSVTQSRLGLLMNGMLKIPMQFFILMIGAMVYVFYLFSPAPVFFNENEIARLNNSNKSEAFQKINNHHKQLSSERKVHALKLTEAIHNDNRKVINEETEQIKAIEIETADNKKELQKLMAANNKHADTNDSNYIFLDFVISALPQGIVGLLIAVIFLAAMGSTASGINSLASTTVIDFYIKSSKKQHSERELLVISKLFTVGWGLFCIVVAFFASKLGNLIEAVNVLGSLFYGTILGIFMVAFFMKKVGARQVFYAAIVAEIFIIAAWWADLMAFLWLNVAGCLLVMAIAGILQSFDRQKQPDYSAE